MLIWHGLARYMFIRVCPQCQVALNCILRSYEPAKMQRVVVALTKIEDSPDLDLRAARAFMRTLHPIVWP